MVKNFILKTITTIMAIIFIISACALDSHSWIPGILCAVSAAWLALFCYANDFEALQRRKR